MCREEERSSRRVVPNKNERPFLDEREGEEMDRAGVDGVLRLWEDPWKIRKELKESDIDHSSRLLLQRGCVETHVLPWMREDMRIQVREGERMVVTVLDEDTKCEHRLMFRYRALRGYQLDNGWNRLFVKEHRLKVGDEIAMCWDNVDHKFRFKVLPRVAHD